MWQNRTQYHITANATRPDYRTMIEFKDIYWLKQILLMKKLCQVQFEWRQEIAPVQHAEDRQSPQDEEML